MKPRFSPLFFHTCVTTAFVMTFSPFASADLFDVNGTTAGFGVVNGSTYDWWGTGVWGDTATLDDGTAASVAWQGLSTSNQQAYFAGSGAAGQNYTVRLGSTGSTDAYIQNIGINVKADGTGAIAGAAGNVTIGNSGDTGKLILSANNSFGAQNSGTLTLNNGLNLNGFTTNFRGGSVTINGSISGTGSSGISSGVGFGLSSGTLTLTGNNSFAGNVTAASGYVISLQNANALGATGGTNSVVSGGTMQVAGGVTITNGESISIAGDGVSSFGALRAGTGGGTWAGGVTLNGTGAGPRLGATTGNTLTVTGTIANGTGNSFNISGQSGTGVVVLNPTTSNTYTGTTSIIRGILRLGKTDALPTGTTLDVDSIDSVADAANFDMAGFSQTVAALQDTAATSISGKITNSVAATTSTLTVNQASNTTFDGVIENGSGSVVLTKSGAGNLTLNGANTFTGGTNIQNGQVIIGAGNNRLATGGIVTLGSVSNAGVLVLGDGTARSQTLAGLTTSGLGGSVVGGAAANSTLTLNVTTGTNAFSGTLGGAGTNENNLALTKTGAGVLTLSGTNTFTGDVIMNGSGNGTIKITNSSSLGTSTTAKTVNLYQGTSGVAQLSIDPGAAGSITLSDKINFLLSSNSNTGSGIVSTTGSNTIQGKITMQSGLAAAAISSATGSTLTLSGGVSANVSGRTLNLGGASVNANTISGNLDNSGGFGDYGLNKNDAGTWILSGSNSYTGLTTIAAGTLKFGNANAIGGSGGLTVSGATAAIDNSSGAALVMDNVGTVTLSNNLTFGGTNALTINSAVNQTADLTVTMNGTAGLTLGNYTNTTASNRILNVYNPNGALTLGDVALSNSATSYNLRIGNNGSSNGKLVIAGVVSDGGTATASSLTIGGSSAGNIVTLANSNTYQGGTTLTSGTLNINNAGALGAGSLTIVGGTMNNTSGAAIVNSNNNTQAWNGDFTFTGTNNFDLGAGAVTMGGTRQITVNGGDLTVGGAIGESGSGFQLRKAGNSGSLTLTGASTYTGNTLVTAGRLYLNHTSDSNPAILGNVSLSSGSNTARAYLYLLADNQLESTATISATISGGNSTYTDFVLGGRSQTIAGYSGAGAVGSGTNYIENRPFGDAGGGNGVLTINNSNTVTLGSGTATNRVNVRDGGSGTLALVKEGLGTLVFNLNGADYSGAFTLRSGLVQVAGTAVGTNTPLKFEGGTLSSGDTTARSFGSGNAVSLDGNVSFGDATNNGKLTFAGASTLTGNRQLALASDVEFSGAIGEDISGRALTKSGSGLLTLSGTNTFTGNTTISGGTLSLTGSGSIAESAVINVQSGSKFNVTGITAAATIGASTAQTLKGLGTVEIGAKILNIGANGTLAPGASPGTLTFDAASGGALNFASGSDIAFELGAAGSGTSDIITFSSAGDWLQGTANATLALTLLSGFDYSNTYTIFENVTTTGFTLADVTGYDKVGYTHSFAQSGNNYQLSFAPVPETSTSLLSLLGGFALLRRRRRN